MSPPMLNSWQRLALKALSGEWQSIVALRAVTHAASYEALVRRGLAEREPRAIHRSTRRYRLTSAGVHLKIEEACK